MTVYVHVLMQHPPDKVDYYIVWIGSKKWMVNSSTNEVELSIDSLLSCSENGLENLAYNVTVTAYNSIGEMETTSSAKFCEHVLNSFHS